MLLFAFGMISVLIGQGFDSINDMIQDDDTLSEQSKNVSGNLYNSYDNTLDGAFALVLVLFYLLLLFIAYQSANNPFLKVVTIVVMILMVVAAIMLAAVYDEVSEDDELSSEFSRYSFIDWTLSNFGLITIIFVLSMITMMGVGSKYA